MPTQAPPDVPASSEISPLLSDYMRRFSTWAFQEINKKVSKTEPQPSLLLTPSDQKQPSTVFQVAVDSAGNLSTTQVPLGRGRP